MPSWDNGEGPASAGRRLLVVAGLVLAAAVLAFSVLWLTGVFDEDPELVPAELAEAAREGGSGDPFAYSDARRAEFEQRAASGYSHVLYEKSPGGIVASARRTAVWRDEIERAAREHGTDPDLMEAMVLLESAGRPEVIAGDDPEAASGLAQIVASTGIDLLGMQVDLARSQAIVGQLSANEQELAKRMAQAQSGKRQQRVKAVQAGRRAGARERGAAAGAAANRRALRPGRGARRDGPLPGDRRGALRPHRSRGRQLPHGDRQPRERDRSLRGQRRGLDPGRGDGRRPAISTTPASSSDPRRLEHDRAWDLLAAFGDDSSTYLWRVLAAERIMRLYRDDRRELTELARLQTAKATAEEVFHPEGDTEAFADPAAIEAELDEGDLRAIPDGREYGYVVGDQLGQLARRLEVERGLYRTLRPEALATLIYMTARVQRIAGDEGTLIVTSATRDQRYQDELVGSNPEATPEYSLHTTGYSFDILRKYRNDRQARAFQFMLDRLRALSVIDYAVEPAAIHVTVSDQARAAARGIGPAQVCLTVSTSPSFIT